MMLVKQSSILRPLKHYNVVVNTVLSANRAEENVLFKFVLGFLSHVNLFLNFDGLAVSKHQGSVMKDDINN